MPWNIIIVFSRATDVELFANSCSHPKIIQSVYHCLFVPFKLPRCCSFFGRFFPLLQSSRLGSLSITEDCVRLKTAWEKNRHELLQIQNVLSTQWMHANVRHRQKNSEYFSFLNFTIQKHYDYVSHFIIAQPFNFIVKMQMNISSSFLFLISSPILSFPGEVVRLFVSHSYFYRFLASKRVKGVSLFAIRYVGVH